MGPRGIATMTARSRRRPSIGILVGNKSLTVTFVLATTNADGSAIGTITDHKIYYDTVPRQGTGVDYAYSTTTGDGTTLSKVITGLLANTTYYVAVATVVSGVESNRSAEESATTSA